MTTTAIFWENAVPTYAVETVEDRVATFAKRAAKRGLPVPVLIKSGTHIEKVRVECSALADGAVLYGNESNGVWMKDVPVEYTDLTLTAPAAVKLDGWRLTAVVSPAVKDGATVPLITDVPGESNRDLALDDAFRCDHCERSLYRTETFVVRHDDGRIKQVGRNCLRDFLGHNPAAMLWFAENIGSLSLSDDEIGSWGQSAPTLYRPEDVLSAAARVVAKVGWYVSRRKAEELAETEDRHVETTVSAVRFVLEPPRNLPEKDRPSTLYPVTEASEHLLADTLTGLDDLRAKDAKGDWEWNVEQVAGLDLIPSRSVGVLASAVILGQRKQERKVAEKAGADLPHETYGEPGSKVKDLPVTVTFTRTFENNWGSSLMIKMRAEKGDLLWWGSSADAYGLNEGDEIEISGTVKKIEDDRFTKTPVTVLSRCRVRSKATK